MTLDWDAIKQNLTSMGVSFTECEPTPSLAGFIEQCGYNAHPMIVNLHDLETVDSDMGVVVTSADETTNDGVYIFSVLNDNSLALITIIASTIAKGPLIRKLTIEYTDAITGVITEPLSTFDMMEIVGQVLANTVMKQTIRAFNIPKDKEQPFITAYLPKFLANVAMYYTGAAKDGKPMVNEEIVNMEPALVRQMVMGDEMPEIFKKEKEEDSNATKDA